MKENGKIFNRFEWNKIIAKSPEELKEKFPVKNLIVRIKFVIMEHNLLGTNIL